MFWVYLGASRKEAEGKNKHIQEGEKLGVGEGGSEEGRETVDTEEGKGRGGALSFVAHVPRPAGRRIENNHT